MQMHCPNCGVVVEASPGELKNCTACGHWWVPPLPDREGGAVPAASVNEVAVEFELQFADGDRWQGPFDRFQLREMLYTERLTGQERVRVPGTADAEQLGERPEFAEILSLLGKEDENTARRSSIVGWKKGGAVADAAEAEKARKEDERRREAAVRLAQQQGPNRSFVVGGLVTIVVLLGALAATLLLT